MPKIPINFDTGEDTGTQTEGAVYNRDMENWSPAVDKRGTGKTILQGYYGLSANSNFTTDYNQPMAVLYVDDRVFIVARDSAGTAVLWSGLSLGGSLTNQGTVSTTLGVDTECKMITNGVNIVIVFSQDRITSTATRDKLFVLATNTLSSLGVDPVYTGFGRVNDVTFINGYYVFITDASIFHGDTTTAGGTGVTFNALSFSVLPFVTDDGQGIEAVNGVIYAFSKTETIIYDNTGTTPFAFGLRQGLTIPVGLIGKITKTVVYNNIYICGIGANGIGVYLLSGVSVTHIPSEFGYLFDGREVIQNYVDDNDEMLIIGTPQNRVYFSNITTSNAKGRSIWGQLSISNPAVPPYGTSQIALPWFWQDDSDKGYYAAFKNLDDTPDRIIRSLYEPSIIENTNTPNEEWTQLFIYSFDYLSNNSDQFSIKSIRFTVVDDDPSSEYELYYTIWIDGTEQNRSLGKVQPGNSGLIEWRRIGRFSSRAQFTLVGHSLTLYRGAVIEGEITV